LAGTIGRPAKASDLAGEMETIFKCAVGALRWLTGLTLSTRRRFRFHR
jgi:hypothetical protein